VKTTCGYNVFTSCIRIFDIATKYPSYGIFCAGQYIAISFKKLLFPGGNVVYFGKIYTHCSFNFILG